jgi:plastocyanin
MIASAASGWSGSPGEKEVLPIARSLLPLLLVLSACAAQREPLKPSAGVPADLAGVDWSGAEPASVTLAEFDFTPDHLRFDHGRPYRLHLENRGSGGHSFDAPAFFGAVALRDDANSAKVRASGGQLELASGEAVDLYFVPQRAGTFPLECSHLLHATFGMTGEIVVQ